MSGHNKWSKIKNKKAVTDAKKSKIFTKLLRMISVEAKIAQGNIDSPGVRTAIEKARAANVPNDNILRAVKKASESGGENLESVTYESYGPGGCALIIDGLTSNRNKAAAEIKHILSKNGYELAAPGSAQWAFTKKDGEWIPNDTMELEDVDLEKLERLVDELEDNDEVQSVYTNVS
ncbi:MAG: YebC/PmpR family DNA-binding transcriptional regulator [Candidatus Zambryskibacteria bacterium CG10_big_fil_rev_8_21_14_0_10_42_12]|uniref:YebC/PmpR family DNA-binding transcriptional regulator n=1 Tax=Candidatus Zambryskibacteria bacterium CG10_big_fil_rev_8_21_14_0_10_42_12 TaxID=1975115 RepID=A0A2H0QSL1_9BACT|nr:MAG: YebC/PmpR family DNA-binding transcriptional regulator [Candidatus Zambryskibacteria bacterium CG10_big_fil_rev_8_21_14_0_10_42_12]